MAIAAGEPGLPASIRGWGGVGGGGWTDNTSTMCTAVVKTPGSPLQPYHTYNSSQAAYSHWIICTMHMMQDTYLCIYTHTHTNIYIERARCWFRCPQVFLARLAEHYMQCTQTTKAGDDDDAVSHCYLKQNNAIFFFIPLSVSEPLCPSAPTIMAWLADNNNKKKKKNRCFFCLFVCLFFSNCSYSNHRALLSSDPASLGQSTGCSGHERFTLNQLSIQLEGEQ